MNEQVREAKAAGLLPKARRKFARFLSENSLTIEHGKVLWATLHENEKQKYE